MVQPKVLISTRKPTGGEIGGVTSMRRFLSSFFEQQGFDITYVFPCRAISGMFSRTRFQIKQLDGIKALQVRSIPYVLLIDQLVAAFSTRRILEQYDVYQSVDGLNIAALPFMVSNKPYVCWVATTIEDEGRLMFHPLHPFEFCRRAFEFSMRAPLYYLNSFLKFSTLWCEKRIYYKATKIVALSRHTGRLIQERFRIPAERVSVIPFPVDTERFRPIQNSKRKIGKDFILMVGRATDPRKNVKLLLRSFSIVKKRFPELKLVIIGKKPKGRQIEKFCIRLGIEDSLCLLGQIPNEDTVEYYTQAKLSVLPSLQEGLGIVVLESMACGTPVVSTRCGGPEEIIIHEENGYLVQNNNAEALANGICRLLANDAMRVEMGERARRHILENYSLRQVKHKFVEVYREVYPDLFDAD